MKNYSELNTLSNFEERFRYLRLDGYVGEITFGGSRYLNQQLYKSHAWKQVRDAVIVRDDGCDLGIEGRKIQGKIIVHHINPISEDDIIYGHPIVFDMNNLICTSHITHTAIHYGTDNTLVSDYVERYPNDTSPWRI